MAEIMAPVGAQEQLQAFCSVLDIYVLLRRRGGGLFCCPGGVTVTGQRAAVPGH